ncbi:MAG: hypothetical protein K8823_1121 [Cenarchaeum symbiont of Oopsacas minuta]|nr:hypothetical protein [Cenarchaeum symbiont of Oopsacas minuta]
MRLGSKSPDEFICTLNDVYDAIKTEYSNVMKAITVTKNVKVMLGDTSITEESTFEPGGVVSFYRNTTENLKQWISRDVMITNNEDCRRIFVKFSKQIDRYLISGHLSLQFHVLLYYRPEYRVVECQKEISSIMDKTKNAEMEMAEIGEDLIIKKIGKGEKNNIDLQKLFEKFYNDDRLTDDINKMVEESGDKQVNEMISKKQHLFKELDGYLTEVYRTSDVLIDDSRLVTGEEGFLCTFDIERVNDDKSRDGLFDFSEIAPDNKDSILQTIKEFKTLMHNTTR